LIPAIVLLPSILHAAGGAVSSPTGTAPDRYVYYPGTEALSKDEIRVTACGTGLPAARRGQAATCFLIELGNGDKFLFDIGTGSMANIAAMMIPYEYLDKVQCIAGMGPIWRYPRNGDGICHGALSQIRELGQGHT
jgi:ribonuclease Z